MKAHHFTRKVASLCMMITAISGLAFGQGGWTDNGTNVRLTTSTDNVGIGTATPYTKLTLTGPIGFTNAATPMSYVYQSGTSNAERFVIAHSPTYPTFGLSYSDTDDKMHFKSNGTPVMTVDLTTKRVGIGWQYPSVPLHVVANTNLFAVRVEQGINGHGLLAYVNTTSSAREVLTASGNVPGLMVLGSGQTLVGLTPLNPEYNANAQLQASIIGLGNEDTYGGYFSCTGGPSGGVGANCGLYSIAQGSTWTDVGVQGIANGPWFGIGVEGCDYGSGGYGVRGYSSNGYGVIGIAGNPENGWAGFFIGDVYATGSYVSSDEKLKRNIQPMDGALDRLMSLNPKTFEYKTDQYEYMSLPRGKRYGFIAQELAQVFPELTKKATQPVITPEEIRSGKRSTEKIEFATVDYLSLVPIIVAALHEQEEIIEQLVTSLEENGIEVNVVLPTGKEGKKSVPTPVSSKTKGKSSSVSAPQLLKEVPDNYDLSNNYPNPFNPSTTIEYSLPKDGPVTIKIYNSLGQEVRTLVDESQEAGYKSVLWDGKNKDGLSVASGTYLYKIQSGDFVKTQKMSFVK